MVAKSFSLDDRHCDLIRFDHQDTRLLPPRQTPSLERDRGLIASLGSMLQLALKGSCRCRQYCTVVRVLMVLLAATASLRAELPSPDLRSIFPAGGSSGSKIEIAYQGVNCDGLSSVWLGGRKIALESADAAKLVFTIPDDLPTGPYDLRLIGRHGISAPRTFVICREQQTLESEPNDLPEKATECHVNSVAHGRWEKPGDIDHFSFDAKLGQQLVIELECERVDATTHGVLELYMPDGRRLAADRGAQGREPLLDVLIPEDGIYRIKAFDQTLAGGPEQVYRLTIDGGPRILHAFPPVIRSTPNTTVTLFGRNLPKTQVAARLATDANPTPRPLKPGPTVFESGTRSLESLELPVADLQAISTVPGRWSPSQMACDRTGLMLDRASRSIVLASTSQAVAIDDSHNHDATSAQPIEIPCDVVGRLEAGDEQDWYAINLADGEVVWLEGFGQRLGAPIDLAITVLDSQSRELAAYHDQIRSLGGNRFPLSHTDPSGRFIAPAAGRYYVVVRNVIGDLTSDPRRIYRMLVRREEPEFHVAVVPRRADQSTGLNVPRGGRELADLFVERRRGMSGPIRVSAAALPPGLVCPDVWVGPDQDHGVVVVAADRNASEYVGPLILSAQATMQGREIKRQVQGGTMVRPGTPTGWGRLTDDTPLAVTAESPWSIRATLADPRVFQDSIIDILIDVDQSPGAPMQITAVGLPRAVETPVETIASGSRGGWLSLAIPDSVPPGPYTFAIRAESETQIGGQKVAVTTFSEPITVQVEPARIHVTIDPRTPRKIARGQIIKVQYRAERTHGFIGKIHTELAAPAGVTGIRGRGVTFTGQTETGEIQIIATENAELGRLVFLRLEAIGTVEDQPLYRGGRFLELEITE